MVDESRIGRNEADAEAAAREASLRYVDDRYPGISRRRRRRHFTYVDAAGKTIRDAKELQRIAQIAIPPAYEDVWICPLPNGHIQATGRDARGRKQYRYHKRWREVRDEAKYRHAIAFAKTLPALRARVEKDLSASGLSREKVVATVVRLLDTTLARVGNEEYARDNASFGLTTLRSKHVKGGSGALRLTFRGKSGVEHAIRVTDRRVASVVRRCRDLPGQVLFTYVDDEGAAVPVTSDDINAYVRETTGHDVTAKDFRTWHATVLCAAELDAAASAPSAAERRRAVTTALKAVAQQLRNTPAVVRSSYVHPAVIDRFLLEGSLKLPRATNARTTSAGLNKLERSVLRFLEREARRDERADLRRALRTSVRQARARA